MEDPLTVCCGVHYLEYTNRPSLFWWWRISLPRWGTRVTITKEKGEHRLFFANDF